MTDHLYNALETCLQLVEQGVDLESCLVRFPAMADELRPILETAVQARAAAVEEVPAVAMQRGRARVLQHAAELRERSHAVVLPAWRRAWQAGRTFRFLATSLTAVVFLFSSGTGLVFASSNSLPGDNLYPVKRHWEGIQLVFIFDPAVRSQREMEFEHERVDEIHELFSESRQAQVDFQGVVEWQRADIWQIGGLQIAIDEDAIFNGEILPGALVRVIGETDDGIIQAEQIDLIMAPPATPVPTATPRPLLQPSETSGVGETMQPAGEDEPEKPESGETETNRNEDDEPPKPEDHSGSGGGNEHNDESDDGQDD